MSRLKALVEQHGMTSDAPVVPKFLEGKRVQSATQFTLFFQGRALSDEMYAEHTIITTEALTTFLILIDAGKRDPAFRKMSRQKERRLRRLLGPAYEVFWEIFLQDQQEQLERQQAAAQAAFDLYPEETSFEAGERVRYLGDGDGSYEEDWVYCTVIHEVWRSGHLDGVVVRREKVGRKITQRPQRLTKEHR